MKPNENHELQRCRDYKEDAESIEKANYILREENKTLKSEIDRLKECIVQMNLARYAPNGTETR